MNHISRNNGATSCTFLNSCHAEGNLAKSEANRQTQSKDPYSASTALGNARDFRVIIRFYDESDGEYLEGSSREAAILDSRARKCLLSEEHTSESRGTFSTVKHR